MGANIAGIYGAQIFRQDDRPRYRRGFSINIAVLAFALILAIIRFLDDRVRRRRAVEQPEAGAVEDRSSNEKARDPSSSRSQSVSQEGQRRGSLLVADAIKTVPVPK